MIKGMYQMLRNTGVDEEAIYAFLKTGRIFIVEGVFENMPEEIQEEWLEAVREYRGLGEKKRGIKWGKMIRDLERDERDGALLTQEIRKKHPSDGLFLVTRKDIEAYRNGATI